MYIHKALASIIEELFCFFFVDIDYYWKGNRNENVTNLYSMMYTVAKTTVEINCTQSIVYKLVVNWTNR